MKLIYYISVFLLLFSCQKEDKNLRITNPEDYNKYLITAYNSTFENAKLEKEYWSKRLRKDSSGIGEIRPLANAYTLMFETSGDTTYLQNAEKLYRKAVVISAHNKDAYQLILAKNLLSQHRYQDAKIILVDSVKGSSIKRASQFILFDIAMKLEAYAEADQLLGKLENTNDYNYLIRLAERNKHLKNNTAAIRNMEAAMKISESRKNKKLQISSYLQLAELYFSSGKIKEAYALLLKTLTLQPDNVQAKMQLARIVYSYENNAKEANRIMDAVLVNYSSSDFLSFP